MDQTMRSHRTLSLKYILGITTVLTVLPASAFADERIVGIWDMRGDGCRTEVMIFTNDSQVVLANNNAGRWFQLQTRYDVHDNDEIKFEFETSSQDGRRMKLKHEIDYHMEGSAIRVEEHQEEIDVDDGPDRDVRRPAGTWQRCPNSAAFMAANPTWRATDGLNFVVGSYRPLPPVVRPVQPQPQQYQQPGFQQPRPPAPQTQTQPQPGQPRYLPPVYEQNRQSPSQPNSSGSIPAPPPVPTN
jgi:hypothetical protein